MYTGLLHLHSFLRYVALILLILSVYKFITGFFQKRTYEKSDDKLSLFTFISMHLQLTIGLILYFISPMLQAARSDMAASMKDPVLRFWSVEHISVMICAITLITVGRITAKKMSIDAAKFKRQAIFFTIGLILILISIPWPFSKVARAWF
jgi:hypothetical protein